MNRQAGTPERAVTLAYNVLRTVKTNKSRNRKYPKVSFVIPCLKIQVERLLWSRFFSHSKNHGRLSACMACEGGKEPFPCFVFRMFTASERWRPPKKGTGQRIRKPQFNYEPFNSSSVNIRFWSWNYRGCWHQTCPPIDTRFWMALNIPHCIPHTVNRLQALFLFAASSFFLTLGNLRACCPP